MKKKKRTTKAKVDQLELAEEGQRPQDAVVVAEVESVSEDGKLVTLRNPSDVGMFERLAMDPNVDVDKLERLIAMQEKASERAAKAAFTQAFAKMQGELPEVKKLGKNPSLSSTYAKFEHIQRAIRPVLQAHGFALSFFVNSGDVMNITARLSHAAGHYEEISVDVGDPAELCNRGVNKVQAKGSAISYAKRYATGALLNIVTVDEDDDGDGAGSEAPEEPDGYHDWLLGLEAVAAEQGTEALQAYWKGSDKEHQAYLTKWNLGGWNKVKATAAAVTS